MAARMVDEREYGRLLHLKNTVEALADAMAGLDTGEVFCCMTCGEAQALADVLSAGGRPEVATFVLEQHAMGDEEPNDDHHDIYLKEWNPNA